MATFGQELKRLADEKGLTTQKKLADSAGVSQQMVAKLYLDQRPNVSAVILYRLCRALGVDCNHFEPFLRDEAQASAPPVPEPPEPKGKRPTD